MMVFMTGSTNFSMFVCYHSRANTIQYKLKSFLTPLHYISDQAHSLEMSLGSTPFLPATLSTIFNHDTREDHLLRQETTQI
jgi:hypothetical protein